MRACPARWIAVVLVVCGLAGARSVLAQPLPAIDNSNTHAQLSWTSSVSSPQSDVAQPGTTAVLYVMLLDHVTSFEGGEIELRWASSSGGTSCPAHDATVYRSAGSTGCTYLNHGLVSPIVLADEPGHFHVQWTNSQSDSSCQAGAVLAVQFDLSECAGLPAQFALCTLSLIDGAGNTSSLPADNLGTTASIGGGGGVTVLCPVSPLTLASLPPFSATEGDTVRFQLAPSGGVAPITFSAAPAWPAGASISASGAFVWPTASNETQVGTQVVQITAADVNGAVASTSATITIASRHVITFAAIPPQNAYEGRLFRLPLYAVSADSTATLTYALVAPAPSGSQITLADNAVFFDWTPAYNAAEANGGVWSGIRVTVNDGVASSAQTLTITVHDQRPSTDTPPVVDAIAPQGVMEEHELLLTPIASDAEGDPLRWSGENLPDGCLLDEVSGTLRWTPDHDASAENGGLYDDVTLIADDGFGGITRTAFPITVFDQPPVIDTASLSCGANGGGLCTHFCTQQVLRVQLQASDDDDAGVLWSARGLPEWLTLDAASGMLSGLAPEEYFGQQLTATLIATELGTAASSSMLLTFAIDCTPVVTREGEGAVPAAATVLRVVHPVASQSVEIVWTLARASAVSLVAYDGAGRTVRRVAEGAWAAGHAEVRWDGRADDGARVSAGVYYLRGVIGGTAVNARCVLLR